MDGQNKHLVLVCSPRKMIDSVSDKQSALEWISMGYTMEYDKKTGLNTVWLLNIFIYVSQKKKRTKVKYKSFSRMFLRAAPASRSEQSAPGLSWTGRSPSIDPVTKKQIFKMLLSTVDDITTQLYKQMCSAKNWHLVDNHNQVVDCR